VTYEALLKYGYKQIKNLDKEEEAVKLLLLELSGQDPHQFYMNLKTEASPEFQAFFMEKLDRYIHEDIPVQHLIGHAYFYGYQFKVNQDVLIPRSETEQLVEHVLYFYDTYFSPEKIKVLDLGTGSGCIGITCALEEEKLDVTISDISPDALKVATDNRDQLQAKTKIVLSDLFENINEKFDILISNPPYIPDDETVENIVLKEPGVALYGGSLGVDFYEKILKEAKQHLNPKALIGFEHGYQQKSQIKKFAEANFPEGIIIQLKDLQGKDRFTFIGLGGVLKDEKR